MKKSAFFSIIIILSFGFLFTMQKTGHTLSVGNTVYSITIRDANDNHTVIPDLGTKVLTIFYADPDASDVNDPLADALKARDFDRSKYRGLGIANLADTIKPNFIIRAVIRRKIEKYNSTILTDPDRTLAKEWGLGNCDGYNIIIVIGKDSRVKYIQKVSTAVQSRSIIGDVLDVVAREIEK